MAVKITDETRGTEMRLKLPDDLKTIIRRFRAKRQLADQPITSDVNALLHLARRGAKAERV